MHHSNNNTYECTLTVINQGIFFDINNGLFLRIDISFSETTFNYGNTAVR